MYALLWTDHSSKSFFSCGDVIGLLFCSYTNSGHFKQTCFTWCVKFTQKTHPEKGAGLSAELQYSTAKNSLKHSNQTQNGAEYLVVQARLV